MSSDEGDDDVKLYNPLQRNQKRKIFVTLSSSSESDDDDSRDISFTSSLGDTSPSGRARRRRRVSTLTPVKGTANGAIDPVINLDDSGDELLTREERARATLRELEIQREIELRLAQDSLLNQTRAIMSKTTETVHQISQDIAADDDDDDSDFEILSTAPTSAPPDPTSRSESTNDGQGSKKQRHIRLKLVVHGKRPEIFKIDESTELSKLHASFCRKHNLPNPDDVILNADGRPLNLSETVGSYNFLDQDEITVVLRNYVDPSAIKVQVRYPDKTTEWHDILPSTQVETLVAAIAAKRSVPASAVSLRIDGETMEPKKTFEFYDLEGGELIEAKV
ncbi:TPA: hypothetical protein N0F65_011203 [Lagenidium giganteum]|uniref:Ubiquitin-like domain-containing protein n=1 Tax=Lagenidium giganteum TaxID=4803 RepID=A0AAV2Z738_9STRA|nr:TPA: hypothetical protein N0F65_011203 [Lagenidium giganteum]